MSASSNTSLMVVISGPSGVGKDTVLEQMKLLNRPWHYIVTVTTRPKREGERNGTEYFFMSSEEYAEIYKQGGFLESAEVYGRWYGVPKSQADEAMKRGSDVIVKTDVQGEMTLRSKIDYALLIFIAPPSIQELERRLRERKSESEEDLQLRIETANSEMLLRDEFDYVVVNYDNKVEDVVTQIDRIIKAEKDERKLERFSGNK